MKLVNVKKELSQGSKLGLNTSVSILFQICAVICGFVLPRLILQTYGSNTNGLLQSITQFLSIISFMELGVGAVIQSALFKPMANDNIKQVSIVVAAGDKFFRRIAIILIGYSFCLTFFFPFIIDSKYGWSYTALLVFSMSVSSFAQYYFGLMDSIILTSNQQGYILYSSQIFTVVSNTVVSAVLIYFGFSIQIVKLSTSIIYLLRPIILRFYIKRHYEINRKIKKFEDPITQKWDGVHQHVSHIILENTDVVVLTLFSSITSVSVYSIYHMVIYGVKNLYIAATHGFLSLLGELWAKQDKKKLNDYFGFLEFGMHTIVVYLFSCMGILIIPFISVYTNGINDANYIEIPFALILVMANALDCIRYPYHMLIKAAGDYKRTQKCFAYSAVINLISSIIAVRFLGLIGVAIGTLIAMLFQAIWLIYYDCKNLIKWDVSKTIKQCLVDICGVCLIVLCTSWIKIENYTYFSWFIMAIKVAFLAFIICLLISTIFYPKQLKYLINRVRK